MSRWIKIAKMGHDDARMALSAISSAAEAKGLVSEGLRTEWAKSACEAALSVRGLRSGLFKEMSEGSSYFMHWIEARDHAAWMMRALGLTLAEVAVHLHCDRTSVSRMSRRYAPL